jgi:peptidyl-dipeptidase Dcp
MDGGNNNPLLGNWEGPYGGVPPFDRVQVHHFKPALEEAMRRHLAAIERIAAAGEPATFDNTLAALERAGREFDRATAIYRIFGRSMSSPEFQAVEREMEPKLAAFRDRIIQNEALFRRVAAVHEGAAGAGLEAEQKRLAWLRYTDFVRGGARLQGAARERLAAINQRLASLYTGFNQNVLADEARAIELHDGSTVPNTRSSVEPFLTYCDDRAKRERVWRAFVSRGDNGGDSDNNAVVAEIVRLRAERARLLGYPTHAHWRLERSMAKTPQRALELMESVWKLALGRVREEVADMRAVAGHEIAPWDYRFYGEKVRKAKYDLDEEQVKPYLQLERLREAMFWVAGELLGLAFTAVDDVPVYHPDVRVWEVKREGRHIGLFYFDPYARAGKVSGAWMNAYRSQERFERDIATLVSNNCNYIKPPPGEVVCIGWNDAHTLFHEFGHALHGLSSNVRYPSLAGTAVDRDYVEFPSQLLEHWLATPEVLDRFARHAKSGQPMPRELVAKIERAAKFNTGFETVEYLGSALVDMRLHLGEPPADIRAFERQALEDIGMPREVGMRHRLAHFGHLFTGEGYSAGYYSYLWADTLTADAFEAFREASGPYDREVAARLCDAVFCRGNTVDPDEAYRAFRGRDPSIEALLRKRGFA